MSQSGTERQFEIAEDRHQEITGLLQLIHAELVKVRLALTSKDVRDIVADHAPFEGDLPRLGA